MSNEPFDYDEEDEIPDEHITDPLYGDEDTEDE